MSDALARGHRIEIRGFGSFSINRRPPRVGRNPRSGEQVVIPEKLVPHFKPGKACANRSTPSAPADAPPPPTPGTPARLQRRAAAPRIGGACDSSSGCSGPSSSSRCSPLR